MKRKFNRMYPRCPYCGHRQWRYRREVHDGIDKVLACYHNQCLGRLFLLRDAPRVQNFIASLHIEAARQS